MCLNCTYLRWWCCRFGFEYYRLPSIFFRIFSIMPSVAFNLERFVSWRMIKLIWEGTGGIPPPVLPLLPQPPGTCCNSPACSFDYLLHLFIQSSKDAYLLAQALQICFSGRRHLTHNPFGQPLSSLAHPVGLLVEPTVLPPTWGLLFFICCSKNSALFDILLVTVCANLLQLCCV